MIDKKRKQCNLRFKAICGPKVTVLFIREEWLRLLMFLKTDLPSQICSEKLLQIRKNTFQH